MRDGWLKGMIYFIAKQQSGVEMIHPRIKPQTRENSAHMKHVGCEILVIDESDLLV